MLLSLRYSFRALCASFSFSSEASQAFVCVCERWFCHVFSFSAMSDSMLCSGGAEGLRVVSESA